MIARAKSFLEYYLDFFRDRPGVFVDLLPEHDDFGLKHLDLDAKFSQPLPPDKNPGEEMDRYTHPCWCNPELIYADDIRGNEVWLHKRVQ